MSHNRVALDVARVVVSSARTLPTDVVACCVQILTMCRVVNVSERRLFQEIDSIQLTPSEVKQLDAIDAM